MFKKDKDNEEIYNDNVDNKETDENNLEGNKEEVKKDKDNDESWDDFSVSNIFDDFWDNSEFEDDINKKQLEIQKDVYYYLWIIAWVLKYINIFLFILIIFVYIYVNIQNSYKSSEVLNPVCSFLLWDKIDINKLDNMWTWGVIGCPSVTLADKLYNDAINQTSKKIYIKLLKVATDYYTMKDFINSKEVVFLLDKSENKKNPLKLLSEFDKAKNTFLWNDRLKIQCKNINVTDSMFTANCDAFSSSWDSKKIPGFNWSKTLNNLKSWTSISVASSFLNFLERQDNFILLNKQKVFKIQEVAWEGSYSYKTPFTIKIEKRELNLK